MLRLRTTELNSDKLCSVLYKGETWYLASDLFASLGITNEVEAFKKIPPQSWKVVVVYDDISKDVMPVKIVSPAGILSLLTKNGE